MERKGCYVSEMVSDSYFPTWNTDRKELSNKLISLVDQTKKELKMSRWIHMPQNSAEYQYNRILCGNCEAFGYEILGGITLKECPEEEGRKIAITYLKKAHVIFKLVGLESEAKRVESNFFLFNKFFSFQQWLARKLC